MFRIFQTRRRAPGRPALSLLWWWTVIRDLVGIFFALVYRIRIIGAERVPPTGPIIYLSNHQTHYDPCIVGLLISDRPFSALARDTLFKSKIGAWVLHGIGAIELERGRGDAGAMKAALAELEAGRCILVFPEGTRTKDGALGTFQRGVMLLIKRSGATVLPIALEGAFDVWRYGTKRPRLVGGGRIMVKSGQPVAAAELMKDGPDAGLERLKREIEMIRLDLRAQLRRATGGRYPAPGPADSPYWQLDAATQSPSSENIQSPDRERLASLRSD